jgi:hypothetical protein
MAWIFVAALEVGAWAHALWVVGALAAEPCPARAEVRREDSFIVFRLILQEIYRSLVPAEACRCVARAGQARLHVKRSDGLQLGVRLSRREKAKE